jgi:conjugal transfer pilin signal peptidase TrbI
VATATREAPAPRWRPRTRFWKMLALAFAGTIVLSSINDWREAHGFSINTTDSLPNWAFVIERGRLPVLGDYVVFDPPRVPLVIRHFGPKPQLFGKIVYGVAGDVVTHDGSIVRINGSAVARMKPRTRFGEPLTPGATGTIPPGCFFAGTPHKDGFDSRYAEIGFVCRRQIVGIGKPLL